MTKRTISDANGLDCTVQEPVNGRICTSECTSSIQRSYACPQFKLNLCLRHQHFEST